MRPETIMRCLAYLFVVVAYLCLFRALDASIPDVGCYWGWAAIGSSFVGLMIYANAMWMED